MKGMRYITAIIATMVAFAVAASDKKLDELISKLDVKNYVEFIDRSNPANFWNAIRAYDDDLQELIKACSEETRKAVKAKNIVAKSVYYQDIYNNNKIIDFDSEVLDKIKMALCGNNDGCPHISIVSEKSTISYSYPNGYIFLSESLFNQLDNDAMIMGFASREMAHITMQHTLSSLYYAFNPSKRNNAMTGLVSILYGTYDIYSEEESPSSGISINNNMIDDFFKEFYSTGSLTMQYKYSREQEIQADIVAYRFLEWCGIGGEHYIKALKELQNRYVNIQEGDNDYPTTKYRIELLEYIHKGEYEQPIEKRYERMWYFLLTNGYKGLVEKEDFLNWIYKDKNLNSVYNALSHGGYPGLGSSKEFKKMVKGEVESIKYTDDIYR